MRWFLRSAVAAAGLGTVGTLALAQYPVHPPLELRPPDMVPPVTPWPEPESRVAPSARALTENRHAMPVPPPNPVQQEQSQLPPLPDRVPDASPCKPAPPVTVQAAIPTYPELEPNPHAANPSAPALTPAAGKTDDEPPTARPDRLPPATFPAKQPALPAPPSPGPLPPIPVAPPAAALPPTAPTVPAPKPPATFPPLAGNSRLPLKPGAPTKPVVTTMPPLDYLPPVPPLSAPDAAKGGADVVGTPAAVPSRGTERLRDVTCDPVWHAVPQNGPVRVRGWLDGGYVYNSSNPDSKFNGPYNSVDRSAEPMFNQAYVIVDRPLPKAGSVGAGFRIDALFGYDHLLGQSRGFEVDRDFNRRWNGQYYGLAIPQAYAEFGNEIVSVRVGHFYTLVGYETLPAVGNFFYSHAYSYQFGQPFTHWGGLITTQLTRHWQVQVGGTNGWDTLVGRANNFNLIGRLKYTPDADWWWASFALVTGDEQNNLARLPFVPGTDGNRTRYSFLLGLTPGGPCGRWEYVFHHYYGWQENGTPQRNFARWYGIDQYLYYRVSNTLRLGSRVEWFRDEDGTRIGLLNRPTNPNNPPLPGNYFSLTGGLNYTPTANLMFRPEIRWDFTSDTIRRAFNDGQKNNQLMLAMDVIWQF